MTFWNHFFMLLASIWAPKTTPKRDPKGNQDQNTKIIDFAIIYYTCATSRGPENHHFCHFFGVRFKIPFRDLFFIDFGPFWGPFGDPLGTQKPLQKTHQKKTLKKSSKWTCLSKGTGSALKFKIVVPRTFQVAPCCWLWSHHVYSPMHFKESSMHVMWSSAKPAALPWPRPTHWEQQLQCDAATMWKCHSEMKPNT